MQTQIIIREISDDEVDLCSSIMANSFANDPLFVWLCKPGFEPFLAKAFGKLIKNREKMGLCVKIIQGGTGVAIIRRPPGKIKASAKIALSFVPSLFSIVGFSKIGRLLKMELATINREFDNPHAYLWYLSISANSQGQGLGKQIVNSVIEEFENVILQTSNPRNLKFYEDLGFEILKEITLAKNGPKIWQFKIGHIN